VYILAWVIIVHFIDCITSFIQLIFLQFKHKEVSFLNISARKINSYEDQKTGLILEIKCLFARRWLDLWRLSIISTPKSSQTSQKVFQISFEWNHAIKSETLSISAIQVFFRKKHFYHQTQKTEIFIIKPLLKIWTKRLFYKRSYLRYCHHFFKWESLSTLSNFYNRESSFKITFLRINKLELFYIFIILALSSLFLYHNLSKTLTLTKNALTERSTPAFPKNFHSSVHSRWLHLKSHTHTYPFSPDPQL